MEPIFSLKASTGHPVEPFNYDTNDIENLSGPLFFSPASRRLEKITFLGILSPRFRKLNSSLFKNISKKSPIIDDGSRLDHSIGVAKIILDFSSQLNFSPITKKYAVSWGLLHDIATWPLSHTGEAAFSGSVGVHSQELRKMMIMDSKKLSEEYHVGKELKKMGVKPERLMSLFNKKDKPTDPELKDLWKIIHSPITPDSLEGIYRSGKVFGVRVLSPLEFQDALCKDIHGTVVVKNESSLFLDFWRSKKKIYEEFINKAEVIKWESSWSKTLEKCFGSLNLIASLDITEEELIRKVRKTGLIETDSVIRYKKPPYL